MDLHGIFGLVASLFIMLRENTYILLRLEFLVVVGTVLLLAMFIMDIFRRHFHGTIMKAIFSIFDGVSYSVIIYVIGAMQTAPFKNELFPVWALVLVIFQQSVCFISSYGISDPGGQRLMEFRNVINLLATALLSRIYEPGFQLPLWSLLAVQILRSFYRFISYVRADKHIWLGWSSYLISEYMRADDQDDDPAGKWKPDECNPETMEGYKYLIYGERFKIRKPRYVMRVCSSPFSSSSSSSMITLDKIWRCRKHLLRPSPDNIQGKALKDLSLAFALSRLLRCRFEDVTLQDNTRRINRNLVKLRIVEEEDTQRGLAVMEMQMAFVNDYYNTRYPMVFWSGLSSVFFCVLQSVVTIAVVCWLSVDIRMVYEPPDGEVAHVVHGVNVDMVITWAFMLFLVFKEVWEMVTYLLSDWTKLLLVCKYVKWGDDEKDEQQQHSFRNTCLECLVPSLSSCKINAKRWHGLLDQYKFLKSYDDRPKIWNLIHTVTTGMVPRKDDGAKLRSAIAIREYVQTAVMEKLRALLDLDEPMPNIGCQDQDLPELEPEIEIQLEPKPHAPPEEPVKTYGRRLTKVLTTLSDSSSGGDGSDRTELYGWACFSQQTSSHVILVWHIATNLCEIALAKEQGVDLRKAGFCRSLVSCFTSACCSAKPYVVLVDVDEPKTKENNNDHRDTKSSNDENMKGKKLTGDLRERFIVANSLSNYCAYLLVSKPDLIPDSFLVPKMVFQETVRSARDDILKGCDSLESRYNKLMEVADQAGDVVKGGNDAVRQGAMLAKQLLGHESDVESRWKILAGVWAELLVHMAPTWNVDAHRTYLESGGEFITNIWALLWHCNVEKSMLWPVYDASQDDDDDEDAPAAAPTKDGDHDGVGDMNPPVMQEETQQAGRGADASDHQNGTEIHVDHE